MIRLPIALASVLGLVGLGSPARADDFYADFGIGLRDARARGGYLGTGTESPTRRKSAPFGATGAPRFDASIGREPAGASFGAPDRFGPRREYVPAHLETRQETVLEPAVYEDRRVPVYETRTVPVFRQVELPIFETRRVPIIGWIADPFSGQRRRVVLGHRLESVRVGGRIEQIEVGRRTESVLVGTRMEHVLVRAESSRIVTREIWVPGRYLIVSSDRRHHGGHADHGFEAGRPDGDVRARSRPGERIRELDAGEIVEPEPEAPPRPSVPAPRGGAPRR